jgi:glucose-1-phosphate thymidylyltransferase
VKGLVLAGGRGTRLRPITYSTAKQLVPVANKPILFYGLEDLAEAGITEVGVIVSPETGVEVKAAVGDGSAFGLAITYVTQQEPLGLAHALQTALPFIDGADVLMYLGDNLVTHGVADVVRDFEEHRPNCQILVTEVPDPSEFGVVEIDPSGHVTRLVEKPTDPPSSLALVGVYLFDSSVEEAVGSLTPSARGEYEITDAIQYLVDQGKTVRPSFVRGWWKDTGKKADLLHANRLVLEDLDHEIAGEVTGSTVSGPVLIGRGSTVTDCHLRGPMVIGSGATVARCDLGPDTAIGDECVLEDATVSGSILMDGCTVRGWRIHDSLLGHGARLDGGAPPGNVEVTLGERSEVIGT